MFFQLNTLTLQLLVSYTSLQCALKRCVERAKYVHNFAHQTDIKFGAER